MKEHNFVLFFFWKCPCAPRNHLGFSLVIRSVRSFNASTYGQSVFCLAVASKHFLKNCKTRTPAFFNRLQWRRVWESVISTHIKHKKALNCILHLSIFYDYKRETDTFYLIPSASIHCIRQRSWCWRNWNNNFPERRRTIVANSRNLQDPSLPMRIWRNRPRLLLPEPESLAWS